jgi:hypothetical protein
MLIGLSVLTAIGLRSFYEHQAKLGSPITLCPNNPSSCPAYNHGTESAVLSELHTIFAGAAVCTVLAGVLALLTLRARGHATPGPSPAAGEAGTAKAGAAQAGDPETATT